jgi:hypothetical protein
MGTEARPRWFFHHRSIRLESFSKWLSGGLIASLRRFDKPKRRHRQIGLAGFLWLGLLAAAYSHMRSLEEIFKEIGKLIAEGARLPLKLVSVSAFTQLRQGFPIRCLWRLWAALAEQARLAVDERYAVWRGLHLWAMDGSGLVLPEELWPRFGAHKGCRGDGPAQAHVVLLYNLQARVPVKLRLGPYDKAKERAFAPRLLSGLGPADLLLIDGGFYSIGLFAHLDGRGLRFLIPMRKNGKAKRLGAWGPDDGLYQIHASPSYWKDSPDVPKAMTVRIVTVHRKGFPTRRLVTNLTDPQAFPAVEIAAVYHERWHIETFYRELKHVLEIERWHARTLRAFYVELLFMMILATLTRLTMAEAASTRCPPGSLSFGKALVRVRYALAASAILPPEQWADLYAELLAEIQRCRIDVRPNRQFERNRQKSRRQSRAKRAGQPAGANS